MRQHIERGVCPCCRNKSPLKEICSVCKGYGEAIIVHLPNHGLELYPVYQEDLARQRHPETTTPVHARSTVARAWEELAAMVEIPPQNVVQRQEMRRAFYAGVAWFLDIVSVEFDDADEPTADDLEYLQRIHAEVMKFNEDIQEGRA